MWQRVILGAAALAFAASAAGAGDEPVTFLPDKTASRIVSVGPPGSAGAQEEVLTVALATKESGPRETVRAFGEVYAFSPSRFFVHREEPTLITFWNLQPDDVHDFMLMNPDYDVLMRVLLPPLRKSSWVFTFHAEGLFRFYCTMHHPEMSGQILVLPAHVKHR